MKLFLSSYQLGNTPERFARLIGNGKRVGVIRNALDFSNDKARLADGRLREYQDLQSIGLKPHDIDLREFFEGHDDLRETISQCDALWVTGGNTFILRRAFSQSGLDGILKELRKDSSFVYGGYSAGVSVLTPTLRGIELVDPPEIVPEGYKHDIIWEGLGFLPFCFAPHFRSDHPESEMIDKSVEFFIKNKMPFVALRDGESLVNSLPFRHTW